MQASNRHPATSWKLAPAALAAFLLCLPAAAVERYAVDKHHAFVGFGVAHFGVATVKGRFNRVDGEAMIDAENLGNSSVTITIEAESIDTGFEPRDNHLRSADFLDTENHPTITFRSEKIHRTSFDYHLTGKLTIRGVTREVQFAVQFTGPKTDHLGLQRVGVNGLMTIKRQDFGISWRSTGDDGSPFVGDEVKIDLAVELFVPPPETAGKKGAGGKQ